MNQQFNSLEELKDFAEREAMRITGNVISLEWSLYPHFKCRKSIIKCRDEAEQLALLRIIESVCGAMGITVVDYWSFVRRRMEPFTYCRHMVYVLLTERGWSRAAVGWYNGKHDHSTICHGLKTHHQTDMQDPDYRAIFEKARNDYKAIVAASSAAFASLIEGESAKTS